MRLARDYNWKKFQNSSFLGRDFGVRGKKLRGIIKKLLFLLLLIGWQAFAVPSIYYTNRKSISFQGTADPNVNVQIFVNGKKTTSIRSDATGQWQVRGLPVGAEGRYHIKAQAYDTEGRLSKFSKELEIIVDRTPPVIRAQVQPEHIKVGEVIQIFAYPNERLVSAKVQMPEGSTSEMIYNSAKDRWEAKWMVKGGVSSGKFNVLVRGQDLASNIGQADTGKFVLSSGAALEVIVPTNNYIFYTDQLEVRGRAENISSVVVNSTPITVRDSGSFAQSIGRFVPGRHRLTFVGEDVLGKRITVVRDILRLITFPDIQSHPLKREIEYLATIGLVREAPGSAYYRPGMPIKRSEVAYWMTHRPKYSYVPSSPFPDEKYSYGYGSYGNDDQYGGYGYETQNRSPYLQSYRYGKRYKDILPGYWAANHISNATSKGLFVGYPAGEFKPEQDLTRAEAVTIVVRYAGVTPTGPGVRVALDVGEKHWASSAFAEAIRLRLLPRHWMFSVQLQPSKQITREELAQLFITVPRVQQEISELLGSPYRYTPGGYGQSPYQTHAPQTGYQSYAPPPDRGYVPPVTDTSPPPIYSELPPASYDRDRVVDLQGFRVELSKTLLQEDESLGVKVTSLEGEDPDVDTIVANFPEQTSIHLNRNAVTKEWTCDWVIPKGKLNLDQEYQVEVLIVDRNGNIRRIESLPFAITDEFRIKAEMSKVNYGPDGTPITNVPESSSTMRPDPIPGHMDKERFRLEVYSPLDKAMVSDDKIEVQGVYTGLNQLMVNGEFPELDNKGGFKITVPLSQGENVIQVQGVGIDGVSQKNVVLKIYRRDPGQIALLDEDPKEEVKKSVLSSSDDALINRYKKAKLLPSHWLKKGFDPNSLIQRKELAYILAGLKGINRHKKPATLPMIDLSKKHWAAASSAYLVRQGIMENPKSKRFLPGNPVSWAYGAVVFGRMDKVPLPKKLTKKPYHDVGIRHWAAKRIKSLKNKGFLKQKGYYYPSKNMKIIDALRLWSHSKYFK